MSGESGHWREGRQAWERIAGWVRSARPAEGSGDPLAALSDIGTVRRLLDEAELEAVRGARRRGRSWSEIAVRLGVTRQSAWERWRDLDEPAVAPAEPPADSAVALQRAAGEVRRRATVTVPDVVGRSFEEARNLLAGRGLLGVPSDPADPPLDATLAVVTDQSPEAGAKAPPGSPVKLWTDRGGGSGVREPRRPRPTSSTGRKYLDEPSEEAVG